MKNMRMPQEANFCKSINNISYGIGDNGNPSEIKNPYKIRMDDASYDKNCQSGDINNFKVFIILDDEN